MNAIEETERPGLAKFSALIADLADIAGKYMPLKIAGLNDKAGYKAVHDARMQVRKKRVEIENTRKELKADALAFGRAVDDKAKELTAILEPVETHLQRQEDAIDAEKERIRQAEANARKLIITNRIDVLVKLGVAVNPLVAAEWTEGEYQARLATAHAAAEQRARQESERLRVQAEEQAARDAQALILAAERAELDRIRAEQQAERERIKAEQDAVAAKQRAEQERLEESHRQLERAEQHARHQAELEKTRKEAAERARVETEERLKREAERKAAEDAEIIANLAWQAREDEEARIKAEEERPQREKINKLADHILAIHIPDGAANKKVKAVLVKAAEQIRKIAAGPLGEDQ